MVTIYVYHKSKNEIEKFFADGFDKINGRFYAQASQYEKEYCLLREGDTWNDDLEDLFEEIGNAMSEEEKEWYRGEYL